MTTSSQLVLAAPLTSVDRLGPCWRAPVWLCPWCCQWRVRDATEWFLSQYYAPRQQITHWASLLALRVGETRNAEQAEIRISLSASASNSHYITRNRALYWSSLDTWLRLLENSRTRLAKQLWESSLNHVRSIMDSLEIFVIETRRNLSWNSWHFNVYVFISSRPRNQTCLPSVLGPFW